MEITPLESADAELLVVVEHPVEAVEEVVVVVKVEAGEADVLSVARKVISHGSVPLEAEP